MFHVKQSRAWGALILVGAILFLIALMMTFPAGGHEPYTDWKRANGGSCCNNQDCAQVQHRFTEKGLELDLDGNWTPVEGSDAAEHSSPDGLAHACWRPYVGLLCFARPGPMI